MSTSSQFEFGFLNRLSHVPQEDVSLETLSAEFNVSATVVEEKLKRWSLESFVTLAMFDGTKERPWHEWGSLQNFFNARRKHANLRVKITARGVERYAHLLELNDLEAQASKMAASAG